MKTEKSPNLAEVKLTYVTKVKAADRAQIKSASAAYELLKGMYNNETVEHHEVATIILLNTASRVLGWVKISEGGITGTVVDVRVIFQHALLANATGVILSHNHPSGALIPSEQDRTITKKVSEAGKILDIRLLDHIIYTQDGYYSFADEGEI